MPLILATFLALFTPPLHFTGKLVSVGEMRLTLETSDGQILTLASNSRSRFLEKSASIVFAQLRAGDNLDVDVERDSNGLFIILEARLAERSAVEAIPTGLRDPDRTANTDPKMALVWQAADAAVNFAEKLPNYLVEQRTTRYVSTTHKTDWKTQDVISAELGYENGKEEYRKITVNTRLQGTKGMMEVGGTVSTGEYGSMLFDLFLPDTDAEFRFIRDSNTAHGKTGIYDFSVKQPNSPWELLYEGAKVLKAAYRGRIWIDASNGRVIRLEQEVEGLPDDYPMDSVQTAVDYDYTVIGGEGYLLPVKAEAISCQRGSAHCSKNVIEWLNYHKYDGQSRITFEPPK